MSNAQDATQVLLLMFRRARGDRPVTVATLATSLGWSAERIQRGVIELRYRGLVGQDQGQRPRLCLTWRGLAVATAADAGPAVARRRSRPQPLAAADEPALHGAGRA